MKPNIKCCKCNNNPPEIDFNEDDLGYFYLTGENTEFFRPNYCKDCVMMILIDSHNKLLDNQIEELKCELNRELKREFDTLVP